MKEINKGSQDGKGNAPPSKRSTSPGSATNSRSGSKLGSRPPSAPSEKPKVDLTHPKPFQSPFSTSREYKSRYIWICYNFWS